MDKKKKSSPIFAKLYFFLILFLIIFSAIYLFNQYEILMSYENQINELSYQIEEQEMLNIELNNQKEYKNSEEYIEKIARDKLGMIKSNEIIFYDTNK